MDWKKKFCVTSSLIFLFGLLGVRADDALFEVREFKSADGRVLPYRLLRPKDYDPSQKYPLLVYLHGAGERGNDNAFQLKHGKDMMLAAARKYQSFVLAPQCPKEARWVEVHWATAAHNMPEHPSEPVRLLLALIPELEKEFSIDSGRRYAIGLSMGGYGVWDLLCRYPDMFAAGVPVCGGGDENKAVRMKDIAVWAFHGSNDKVVNPHRSRNMIEALKKIGGQPRYTEYPGVGHNAWVAAFQDTQMLAWLFAQKRK